MVDLHSLQNKEPLIQFQAAERLRDSARDGWPLHLDAQETNALWNLLDDRSIQKEIAQALAYHYWNIQNWGALQKLLKHPDAEVGYWVLLLQIGLVVEFDKPLPLPALHMLQESLADERHWIRRIAAQELVQYYLKKGNPKLQELLASKDSYIVSGIAVGCGEMAKQGMSIAPIVPFLEARLPNPQIPYKFVEPLIHHYARRRQFQKIEVLLKHPPRPHLVVNTLLILGRVDPGIELTPLVPLFAEIALRTRDLSASQSACDLLANAVSKHGDGLAFFTLLQMEGAKGLHTQQQQSFERFVSTCESPAKLDAFQIRVEQEFAAWWKNQSSASGSKAFSRKIEMEKSIICSMRAISERKVVLAKGKDGELLAGETIPRPAGKTGWYGVVRMRT